MSCWVRFGVIFRVLKFALFWVNGGVLGRSLLVARILNRFGIWENRWGRSWASEHSSSASTVKKHVGMSLAFMRDRKSFDTSSDVASRVFRHASCRFTRWSVSESGFALQSKDSSWSVQDRRRDDAVARCRSASQKRK